MTDTIETAHTIEKASHTKSMLAGLSIGALPIGGMAAPMVGLSALGAHFPNVQVDSPVLIWGGLAGLFAVSGAGVVAGGLAASKIYNGLIDRQRMQEPKELSSVAAFLVGLFGTIISGAVISDHFRDAAEQNISAVQTQNITVEHKPYLDNMDYIVSSATIEP